MLKRISDAFLIANTKKNEEFHLLFKNIQAQEQLIDVFNCALQKDILLQGKLYVAERHLCFNSNIFGWVTNLIINLEDVIAIEKKFSALIFPNSLLVSTLHAKYFFASFLNRDVAYSKIVTVWKAVLRSAKLDALILLTEERTKYSDIESVFFDDSINDEKTSEDPWSQETIAEKELSLLEKKLQDDDSQKEAQKKQLVCKCGCHHHGPVVFLNSSFFMNLHSLYSHLFGMDHKSLSKFYQTFNYTDVSIGNWVKNDDEIFCRVLSFSIPFQSYLYGNKFQVSIIEKIVWELSSKSAVVAAKLYFPNLPFSNLFEARIKYCFYSVDFLSCHLMVSADVNIDCSFTWMKNAIQNLITEVLRFHFQNIHCYFHKIASSTEPHNELEKGYTPLQIKSHRSEYKRTKLASRTEAQKFNYFYSLRFLILLLSILLCVLLAFWIYFTSLWTPMYPTKITHSKNSFRVTSFEKNNEELNQKVNNFIEKTFKDCKSHAFELSNEIYFLKLGLKTIEGSLQKLEETERGII